MEEVGVVGVSGNQQPTIAVVGSGPSGCYTAQFLRKMWPGSEIVVVDALPAPYGLVRYGVAADHQGAKGVTRQFDRLFERDGVRFIGNVRIGTDVAFEELVEAFDVVVLATGLTQDRPLAIPQHPRARTVGAGFLLRGLNGYPGIAESDELDRTLGSRVAIVGNGNVAMDALRLLVKDRPDLHGSDVDDQLLDVVRPVPIQSIDVVGRSTASNAKFDLTVLRELGQLSNVDIQMGETAGDDHNPVMDTLRNLAARSGPSDRVPEGRVMVTFHFGQTPRALDYANGQTVLDTQGTDDPSRTTRYAADAVVTAVGFEEGDDTPPVAWNAPNVWRVGWLRRGASGTIPENRRDAKDVSERIGAAVRDGLVIPGKPGLASIWPKIADDVVEFQDWRRLDEHERLTAPEGRCRRKVTDVNQMVGVAAGLDPASPRRS